MKAQRLPYDMGNAGDLIKHGLLAEFTEWWFSINNTDFVFLDPFGGRPYVLPPHPEVIRRIQQLADCALKRAQPDVTNRYYGSANVVKNITASVNRKAVIKVSDRDPIAFSDLLTEGFEGIRFAGFDSSESFSIVDCSFSLGATSLLLLDPFDDFLLKYAHAVIPKLSDLVSNSGVPIVLFVICDDWCGQAGIIWQELKSNYLSASTINLSLSCQNLSNSRVRGERNLNSEAILLLPKDISEQDLKDLRDRLKNFKDGLSFVLAQDVGFTEYETLMTEAIG